MFTRYNLTWLCLNNNILWYQSKLYLRKLSPVNNWSKPREGEKKPQITLTKTSLKGCATQACRSHTRIIISIVPTLSLHNQQIMGIITIITMNYNYGNYKKRENSWRKSAFVWDIPTLLAWWPDVYLRSDQMTQKGRSTNAMHVIWPVNYIIQLETRVHIPLHLVGLRVGGECELI